MEVDFKGKTVFVTGAGQGIGYELCKRVYAYGGNVYAVSLDLEPLQELQAACPNVKILAVDLSNWTETRNKIKAWLKDTPVHHLVNNAGVTIVKPFEEMTEQDYDFVLNVNTKAVFNVTQTVLPNLQDGGSIVNMSSLAALSAFHGHTVYQASKAAVDGLTKCLALELGPRKIRVNSVNPTAVMTAMGREVWSDPAKAESLWRNIPLYRFGEVKEVLDAIVFLLSDRSSFITGHLLPLDGGYSAC